MTLRHVRVVTRRAVCPMGYPRAAGTLCGGEMTTHDLASPVAPDALDLVTCPACRAALGLGAQPS